MLEMHAIVEDTHRRMDRFLQRWITEYRADGGNIYCGKSCANCCHMAVHSTFPEALLVADQLADEHRDRLDDYIDRLLPLANDAVTMNRYLKQHRDRLDGCPFLRSDTCSLYPMRPLTCRALLSTRSADWCGIDLARLDEWDRRLYQQSLDARVVAWPTHYVAATQDLGRQLEQQLLHDMRQQVGWSLAGNLPLLVWLATRCRLNSSSGEQVAATLADLGCQHTYLLDFTDDEA